MVNGECLGDLGAPHVKGSVSLMMNEGTRIGTICEERDALPLTGAPDPAGATGRSGAPRPAPHLTHRPRPESRPAARRHRGVALACAALALLGLLAHPSTGRRAHAVISNTGSNELRRLGSDVAFTTGTGTSRCPASGHIWDNSPRRSRFTGTAGAIRAFPAATSPIRSPQDNSREPTTLSTPASTTLGGQHDLHGRSRAIPPRTTDGQGSSGRHSCKTLDIKRQRDGASATRC